MEFQAVICIDKDDNTNDLLNIADSWTYECLIEEIHKMFDLQREISHLQIWDKKFSTYVKLKDMRMIQDGVKINVVLKKPEESVAHSKPQSTPEKPPELQNICETCFLVDEQEVPSNTHSQESEGEARGVCSNDKLWNKSTLSVWFLNPIPQSWTYRGHKYTVPNAEAGHIFTENDILRLANLWSPGKLSSSILKEKREMVPAFLPATDAMDSDIRIFCTEKGGCSSRVGTDASLVKKGDKEVNKTMTLNLSGDDDSYKEHLVLHEFGHTLGLSHEHQRAVFWNNIGKFFLPDVVEKYFGEQFKGDVAQSYITDPEESPEYDAESIMHYNFQPSWLQPQYNSEDKVDKIPGITDNERKYLKSFIRTQGKLAVKLSKTDMTFIAEIYYKKRSDNTSMNKNSSASGSSTTSNLSLPSKPNDAVDIALKHKNLTKKDRRVNTVLTIYLNDQRPFLDIANLINNWEGVAQSLGLQDYEITGIKAEYSFEKNRKFQALSKWWNNGLGNGTATFLVLITALAKCGEQSAIDCACNIAANLVL